MDAKVLQIKYIYNTLTRYIILPLILLLIGCLWNSSDNTCQAVSHGQNYYKGAVVEFSPVTREGSESPEHLIMRNVDRYKKIINEAGKEKVDIIVFPECTLTTIGLPFQRDLLKDYCTFIPDVKKQSIPCTDKSKHISEHLRTLSCTARSNNLYLVVNLEEKVKCDVTESGCPSDGLLFYNSNIVFDRHGKIIAKYRKFNLFIEPQTNVTAEAELVTFDTDFGVRFGMFICFDILFYEPAIKIIEKTRVKNIVYSTMWFSELPFLTATQIQSGYSYSQNVNFLAAGYSRPNLMSGGSGIFAGELGPLVSIMPEEATTKLLIANVPKDHSQHKSKIAQCSEQSLYCSIPDSKIINIDFNENDLKQEQSHATKNGFTFYHQNLTGYATEMLNSHDENNNINNQIKKSLTFSYEHTDFDCEITVDFEKDISGNTNGPFYRAVSFAGNRTYADSRTVYTEVCAVIACVDDTLQSCGYRPDFKTTDLTNIQSISIKFESKHKSNPYVVTLDKDLLSLPGNDVSFTKEINEEENVYSGFLVLEKPHEDLITFGIYKS